MSLLLLWRNLFSLRLHVIYRITLVTPGVLGSSSVWPCNEFASCCVLFLDYIYLIISRSVIFWPKELFVVLAVSPGTIIIFGVIAKFILPIICSIVKLIGSSIIKTSLRGISTTDHTVGILVRPSIFTLSIEYTWRNGKFILVVVHVLLIL
jgi:hypothetical protein